MASTLTQRVLAAVQDERWRQVRKWGEQSHKDDDGPLLRESYEGMANAYKALFAGAQAAGKDPSWAIILLEEVYEALAEAGRDEAALEKELIEVAAVAVAWVEDLRSRRATTD